MSADPNAAIAPTKSPSSAAWFQFESRLAEVLSALQEDQFLVISAKRQIGYVQFAAQGSFGLRAEAVSNNYLPAAKALSAEQVAALQTLGWLPPTGTPLESTPRRQPDGSPNFFRDYVQPVPHAEIATLAVRTLREVLGVPHPGHLTYQSFDIERRVILLPTLGLKHRPAAPRVTKPPATSVEQVRERVVEVLRKASGESDLEFDDDGRMALRFGSAIVFVRVHKDPLRVSIASPVLANVERDDQLTDRLNELNTRVQFARFFTADGTVYAVLDVPASPFVAEHVVNGCWLLGRLADEIDELLQREFGGRTTLGEFSSKHQIH